MSRRWRSSRTYADALCNRGIALRELKRPAEALASFERALALEPDHRYAFAGVAYAALATCDWARTEVIAGELERRIAQDSAIVPAVHAAGIQQRRVAAAAMRQEIPRGGDRGAGAAAVAGGEPRVTTGSGSPIFPPISAGMRWPPCSRSCSSCMTARASRSSASPSARTTRARCAPAWCAPSTNFTMSDRATTAMSRKLLNELEVDIAVDLNGRTEEARLGILARRPAPVQATYLGYPGTTGADFIDYVIADPTVLPLDQQPFYTEKIVHLPECYQVNDSTRKIAADTPTRREAGLPDDGFVFCCFNNNFKITAPVFDVWMRLMGQVEGSVLWLLQDDAARENLRGQRRRAGSTRPAWCSRTDRSPRQHLARHRLADLFLDTLPYNAHTTASDALWAGLPVLTCKGAGFAGRVAASLLYAAGLPELVTSDLREYEALALRLATDASLLRGLRQRLAQNRATCPLFDTDRFRRHIESAYTHDVEDSPARREPAQLQRRAVARRLRGFVMNRKQRRAAKSQGGDPGRLRRALDQRFATDRGAVCRRALAPPSRPARRGREPVPADLCDRARPCRQPPLSRRAGRADRPQRQRDR